MGENMGCFGCFGEGANHRPADKGCGYILPKPPGRDGYRIVENSISKPPVKVIPIAVPSIPMGELRDGINNYGSSALIGDGSYGRVYYRMLKSGRAAIIKKLDASKQSDDEFLAQN